MNERKVAFITGASRGIGAAAAVALAEKGYDIVATARTVKEGETADGRPLPGSLESTVEAVNRKGREALSYCLDLLDASSIDHAISETFREWGQIDLLLNNGIFTGQGSMELFLDLNTEMTETLFRANFFAQIQVTQRILPEMLKRKHGIIINMVSNAGLSDPPAPAQKGGWGYAYAASKAALHRMVGVLAVEHPNLGVFFHNLEPGFVMTEAMALNDPDGSIAEHFQPAPPSVPAAAIAWLATDPGARAFNGNTIFAQPFCLDRSLHPDWR